jgi:hypothetical protein
MTNSPNNPMKPPADDGVRSVSPQYLGHRGDGLKYGRDPEESIKSCHAPSETRLREAVRRTVCITE